MKKFLARKIICEIVFGHEMLDKSSAITIANTICVHGGKMLDYTKCIEGCKLRVQTNEASYEMIKDVIFDGINFDEVVEDKVRILIIK